MCGGFVIILKRWNKENIPKYRWSEQGRNVRGFVRILRLPKKVTLHDERIKNVDNRVKKLKQEAEVRERYMFLKYYIEEEAEKVAKEMAKKMAEEMAKEIAKEKAEEIAKEKAEEMAKEKAEKLAEEKITQERLCNQVRIIRNAQENNLELEVIAKITDCEISYIKKICQFIVEHPELSDEEITEIKMANAEVQEEE